MQNVRASDQDALVAPTSSTLFNINTLAYEREEVTITTLEIPPPPPEVPKPAPTPPSAPKKPVAVKIVSKPTPTPRRAGLVRNYAFARGNCTIYVAGRFIVTWRGNANEWATNARVQGYLVDRNPVAGAILQTNENRKYGHVAYIERVDAKSIYVSEMNVQGFGVTSSRAIPKNSSVIRAVIHPL